MPKNVILVINILGRLLQFAIFYHWWRGVPGSCSAILSTTQNITYRIGTGGTDPILILFLALDEIMFTTSTKSLELLNYRGLQVFPLRCGQPTMMQNAEGFAKEAHAAVPSVRRTIGTGGNGCDPNACTIL